VKRSYLTARNGMELEKKLTKTFADSWYITQDSKMVTDFKLLKKDRFLRLYGRLREGHEIRKKLNQKARIWS
jgi:hypothetical protein